MRILIIFLVLGTNGLSTTDEATDGEGSRKILGSSVVTSVSVIMDTGNGSKTVYTDAVGRPIGKPATSSELASPINLLNPDRYEFYTFDDNGELIKRLMSLDEIKGIIATGDTDGLEFDSFTSQGYLPEGKVNEVVNTVQNVLKEEMETHKNALDVKPLFDTPDVSDSWSMILPAVFGNSGEDIKPEKPIAHVTPDTIMIEPNMQHVFLTSNKTPGSTSLKPTLSTTPKPTGFSTSRSSYSPVYYSTTKMPLVESTLNQISTLDKLITLNPGSSTARLPPFKSPETKPLLNVEIFSKSKSTTVPVPVRGSTLDVTEKITHYESRSTTRKPTTVNVIIAETKTTQDEELNRPTQTSSTRPSTIMAFTSVSTYSTLPTTSATQKLDLGTAHVTSTKMPTKRTTEAPISSWNAESTTSVKEAPSTNRFSTWRPELPVSPKPEKHKLPTLSELIKSKEEITSTLQPSYSEGLTTFTIVSEDKTTTDTDTLVTSQTKYYGSPATGKITDDNSGTSLPETTDIQINLKTTTPPEETRTTNVISPSELLNKLLLTTNIYDINTELSQRTTNIADFPDEDQRFETSTQEVSKNTELNSVQDTPTTEKFVITVTEETVQPPTDRTLIGSIEQLLSQAVNNVENVLADVNDTNRIQDLLTSYNKTMSDVKQETATLASSLADGNTKEEIAEETTTAPGLVQGVAASDTSILSESLGSLLSQVSGGTEFGPSVGPVLAENYPQVAVTTTQKSTLSFNTDETRTSVFEIDLGTTENLEPSTTPRENVEADTADKPKPSVMPLKPIQGGSIYPLVNLTILNSESLKNRTKPAKLDVSLEQPFLEAELANEKTEIYIEPVFNTSKYSTERYAGETLNVDETNNIKGSTNEGYQPSNFQSTTITPNNFDSPGQIIAQTTSEKDTPTTIVIIRRTERPPSESTTDYPKENESTTDANQTEESEILGNKTTATFDQMLDVESITNLITEPSVEIIIDEHRISQTSTHTNNVTDAEKHSSTENYKSTPLPSENSIVRENQTTAAPKLNKTDAETKPESTWTLIPTIAPHGEPPVLTNLAPPFPEVFEPPVPINLSADPMQGFGLEESTSRLDNDIFQFAQLCNELAFGFWKTVTGGLSTARSVFVSPFGATSLLAMVFLGARGATSGEMNEILRLDDMVTFNPHLIFKNVSESVKSEGDSGVAVSAIIRELFSDRSKGKLLPFYKERARAFYDGFVEEVSFREIGDVIRRRTNLQVKKHSGGRMPEFLKDSSIYGRSPLAGISVNLYQTDCSQASTEGRDGELHFVVLPSIRQRRLVPIPAVVYKSGFLAGYEPSLDATAVSLGTKDKTVSTILVIPGQQGIAAPGDGLARLEKRLVESSFKKGAWSRLLRSLIPRSNLEVHIPRFSHKSVINATLALQRMGLHELFDIEKADLRGLNGVPNELFLSDIIQINNFATCGEKVIGDTHHSEVYPASTATARGRGARFLQLYQSDDTRRDIIDEPRDYQRAFHDPLHDPSYLDIPLPLRPRQARVPETPRLKFDRPFLYFIRHNPTGLILHMGRFNPRLLP